MLSSGFVDFFFVCAVFCPRSSPRCHLLLPLFWSSSKLGGPMPTDHGWPSVLFRYQPIILFALFVLMYLNCCIPGFEVKVRCESILWKKMLQVLSCVGPSQPGLLPTFFER